MEHFYVTVKFSYNDHVNNEIMVIINKFKPLFLVSKDRFMCTAEIFTPITNSML